MKFIKIFTKSQLILLRNINPLLGQNRLPRGILRRIDYILEEKNLGRYGFLLVILTPVHDDVHEIEDAVNIYPLEVIFTEELTYEKERTTDKGREWFTRKLYIQNLDSSIYVLYCMSQKHLKRYEY